jgi:hypothetical protein
MVAERSQPFDSIHSRLTLHFDRLRVLSASKEAVLHSHPRGVGAAEWVKYFYSPR